jgi:hypothetical protein
MEQVTDGELRARAIASGWGLDLPTEKKLFYSRYRAPLTMVRFPYDSGWITRYLGPQASRLVAVTVGQCPCGVRPILESG